ncbi:MAG: YafY family transcriptional regulator [Chloroflexi bacterium]|nr:YafY family transcriptional regulator [Chloroflexota bacterium]
MNRVDRLFAILLKLQNQHRLRAQDLADAFAVSKRTIYRDLNALNEMGVPIISLPGEGFELMDTFFLPPVLFTADEAGALFLGARMLHRQSSGYLPGSIDGALEKLWAVLPDGSRHHIQTLSDIIQFGLPANQFNLDNPKLLTLQRAITERRVIFVRYHSYGSNEVTERQVEPLRLYFFGNHWLLIGYCRLRQAERVFRLERMDDLTLLNEAFPPREVQFPARQRIEVVVRFKHEIVRWVHERQFEFSLQSEEDTPDGVIMRYRVPDDKVMPIKAWILSWGAGVTILEPHSLAEDIAAQARRMLDNYPVAIGAGD